MARGARAAHQQLGQGAPGLGRVDHHRVHARRVLIQNLQERTGWRARDGFVDRRRQGLYAPRGQIAHQIA